MSLARVFKIHPSKSTISPINSTISPPPKTATQTATEPWSATTTTSAITITTPTNPPPPSVFARVLRAKSLSLPPLVLPLPVPPPLLFARVLRANNLSLSCRLVPPPVPPLLLLARFLRANNLSLSLLVPPPLFPQLLLFARVLRVKNLSLSPLVPPLLLSARALRAKNSSLSLLVPLPRPSSSARKGPQGQEQFTFATGPSAAGPSSSSARKGPPGQERLPPAAGPSSSATPKAAPVEAVFAGIPTTVPSPEDPVNMYDVEEFLSNLEVIVRAPPLPSPFLLQIALTIRHRRELPSLLVISTRLRTNFYLFSASGTRFTPLLRILQQTLLRAVVSKLVGTWRILRSSASEKVCSSIFSSTLSCLR